MPAGVPVATMAIDGAKNAALMAIRILGSSDEAILGQMDEYRSQLKVQVSEKNQKLKDSLE